MLVNEKEEESEEDESDYVREDSDGYESTDSFYGWYHPEGRV